MSGRSLPYCTPRRRRLVEHIQAGNVRYYHWAKPVAMVGDSRVTDQIEALSAAGLVNVGVPDVSGGVSKPTMTTDGDAWYERQLARDAGGG